MFTIRSAVIGDLSLIVDFQVEMALESEGVALSRRTIRSGAQAVLGGSAVAEYLIIEADGTPVGMLMTVPEWSDWRNGTVVWLHSVYVRPSARRQKAFTALYEHVKRRVMASDGLVGVRLYVDQANQRAQGVYGSLGMTREHYYLYEWLKDS